MQAAIWGEAIRSPDHMFYMAFPRLFALAERSWHKATWEDEEKGDAKKRNILSDWTKFANRLGQRELLQLDKLGVKYRIPLPGARYHNYFFQNSINTCRSTNLPKYQYVMCQCSCCCYNNI